MIIVSLIVISMKLVLHELKPVYFGIASVSFSFIQFHIFFISYIQFIFFLYQQITKLQGNKKKLPC